LTNTKYIRLALGGKEQMLTRTQFEERLNLVATELGTMGLRATGRVQAGWRTTFRLWFRRPIRIPTVLYVEVEMPPEVEDVTQV
jgi:hypothetical protein